MKKRKTSRPNRKVRSFVFHGVEVSVDDITTLEFRKGDVVIEITPVLPKEQKVYGFSKKVK